MMSCDAIRALPAGVSVKKHSGVVFLPGRAGMYAEATENPNAYSGDLQAEAVYEAAVEAQGLLKEFDRAVELLRRVVGCLGVKGCLSSAGEHLRNCGVTGPVLADEVRAFLDEMEGE